MKYNFLNSRMIAIGLTVLLFTSCTKDLDLQPTNSNTADIVYSTPEGYKSVLAKVYGSYSLISSTGVGNSDVPLSALGTDQAPTDFIRSNFNLQELTTDNAICAWNDGQLQSLHNMNWIASNVFIQASYARSLYQITVCNEFIRQSTDDKIALHGFSAQDVANIKQYRAEARFLRAYQYWVLMDLFGNPPFVTEKDPIGKFIPPQIQRADLFNYIEKELTEIDAELVPARQNEYGRADQAAAWALLARIYINAKIYTGTDRSTDAITYAKKVIDAGYSLKPVYKTLFMSDNNVNNPEIILPITYDAMSSQNYGGTTFLICSSNNNDAPSSAAKGIPGGGWLGNRSTKNLPLAFGDYSGLNDKRALFGSGSLDVNDELDFTQGLIINKFSNLTSTGNTPQSPNGVLCSTDFPIFRLAEMYLIYAEAVLRNGSGGTMDQALEYMNDLRERAYGNSTNGFTTITLDDVLNERQRELYWECCRRTDLIRFGKFTSSGYLWPWKGGVQTGAGVDDHLNLFPIPSADIIANPNLKQNNGY
ncbi:RagB/SusD family nutrient uptake outer membrane protein [Ferruginibacter albus]|uniref:RagB/SusD family nutrient uptake outer membrane protein n=1 Tax=Ferruginibacter albus TaxID=2875540 RepID=UPI001CC37AD7|nr:RagB/SusD family nutrient uptake outer membrane protein [Ferruginibacter albus]UAY51873.1 RagB/SusD family nutrient uptake outer membrane protein [Ferruginibacter albus]